LIVARPVVVPSDSRSLAARRGNGLAGEHVLIVDEDLEMDCAMRPKYQR
jgi:hypothetical protein